MRRVDTVNQVELVLTDEREIFARMTVIAATDSALQTILAGMNSRRDDSMARGAKWRQAILNVSDAGQYCPGCGARHCWCGLTIPLTRDGIPAW